jgi:hypothetical protein
MKYSKIYAMAAGAVLAGSLAACGGGESPDTPDPPAPTSEQPKDKPEAAPKATLPNLTGMVLQDAQDKAQSVGFYLLDDQDALYNRIQALDSNWKVCSQEPKPGEYNPDTTTVVLTSVKLDESCP